MPAPAARPLCSPLQGKGSKLRDIPNVAFKMGKLTGRDELLEGLHLVLFRRKGTVSQAPFGPPCNETMMQHSRIGSSCVQRCLGEAVGGAPAAPGATCAGCPTALNPGWPVGGFGPDPLAPVWPW